MPSSFISVICFRYFFPSRAKEARKRNKNYAWSQVTTNQLISYLRSSFRLAVGDLGTRLSSNLTVNPVNLTTVHNNAIFQKKQQTS